MYQLIELGKGRISVISTGSWIELNSLKKSLLSKIRGALIIKKIEVN